MARKIGRSTGWECKGRTRSAWGENWPCRLLASHFYFASAAAGTGWVGVVGDESGDASVVGIRLGVGRGEGEDFHGTGVKKLGGFAAMVRRWASTCFAFMLPKVQVGAFDLFAGTEGTLRGVSNKGVSS